MTTIPQLPPATTVGLGDLLPLSQAGSLYSVTVGQLTSSLQPTVTLPTGDLLGRISAGSGGPEPVALGAGLALAAGSLAANGGDHANFPVKATFSLTDQVVLNSAGTPALLDLPLLRGLFSAGTGIAIDGNGMISVTVSAVAGPQGPQGPAGPAGPVGPAGATGPQGAGLAAPNSTNSASAIGAGDYVAIWQNGANGWITYQQLIGGQTIDQLPAAGPARDSDELLVAQGGNSLSSQSFAAIWTYIQSKLPTLKLGIVELTASTVLDGTSHNGRLLVASQPLTLTANFANMGSGFSCRIINLSSGAVSMGTGITAGNGATSLPPGAEAMLIGISYSGGSLVWWSGAAPSTPTITVSPIVAPAPGTAFTVSGSIFDDAATALDYSTDGTSWTAAPSPAITANSYSFEIPGLPAGSYTVHVRDHANPAIAAASNNFTIAAASIALTNAPASMAAGVQVSISGTVAPAGTSVEAGFSPSASTAPASFVAATTSGTSWTASLTAPASGTAYLWAQQTADSAIQAVSAAIPVTAPALTVSAPGTGTAGTPLAVTGTLAPAGSAVNVQLATQNTTAPGSNWISATVSGGSFSAELTPATAGTYYVWAQDPSNGLTAVSATVTVAAATTTTQASVSYTVNQPGTTSYAAGSGTIALNGGISPAQNVATQVAFSTSNAAAPSAGWQSASIIDNNSLWAVYMPIPATAGSYYVWVETAAGASATVSSFTLTIS